MNSRRVRRNGGMALVLVLWVITLLVIIAGSFTLGVRREAGTLRYLVEVAQARAAAEAGVRVAMLGLTAADPDLRWKPDGAAHELIFGNAVLEVRVRDEAGRVDINLAEPQLIDAALAAAGMVDAGERETLRDNILAWRSPASGAGGVGATQTQGGREFLAVEELLLVPGMSAALYRRLLPMVTVHSGQAAVNAAVAPPELLLALPGLDPSAVDAYLAEREAALAQGRALPGFPGQGFGAKDAMTYSVQSVARLPSGLEQGLRVVMVREAAPGGEPYKIIHYRLETST